MLTSGTFHRAQTLKLGGVNSDHIPLDQSEFPTSFENYIHSKVWSEKKFTTVNFNILTVCFSTKKYFIFLLD